MIKTQKFQIKNPNANLINFFERNFGFRRWCWNQALTIWNRQAKFYSEEWKKGNKKIKYPNSWFVRDKLKKILPEWSEEYSIQILDCACDDLQNGFRASLSREYKKKFSMKFKSKKDQNSKTFSYYRKDEKNFSLKEENDKFYFSGPRMTIKKGSHTKFWLQLSEKPKFTKEQIKSATVYFRDNKYWITISYEFEPSVQSSCQPKRIVGCDWGTKTFLSIAYGSDNQRHYKKFNKINKELKKLNKKISSIQSKRDRNCKFHSNRWNKLTNATQRYRERANNLKDNQIKTNIAWLTKRFGTIVIEDLDISNLTKKTHKNVKAKAALNRGMLNNSFYKFKMHLQHKCEETGRKLILADRHFASTQICSHCGHRFLKKEKLTLKNRQYICPDCGVIEDRDFNAAYNLKLYAQAHAVGSSKVF